MKRAGLSISLFSLALLTMALVMGASMDGAPMDKIFLRPGMTLMEVEARSGIRFELASRRDDSAIVIERPLVVNYLAEVGSIAFPPTLMLWINQLGATVIDFEISPQLKSLELVEARELAVDMAHRISAAGWKPDPVNRNMPPFGDLSHQFDNRPLHTLFSRSVGTWTLEGVVIDVTLKQLVTRSTDTIFPLSEARFLVKVYVSDEGLRGDWRKRVVERRRALGKRDDDPLPLSAWVGAR